MMGMVVPDLDVSSLYSEHRPAIPGRPSQLKSKAIGKGRGVCCRDETTTEGCAVPVASWMGRESGTKTDASTVLASYIACSGTDADKAIAARDGDDKVVQRRRIKSDAAVSGESLRSNERGGTVRLSRLISFATSRTVWKVGGAALDDRREEQGGEDGGQAREAGSNSPGDDGTANRTRQVLAGCCTRWW